MAALGAWQTLTLGGVPTLTARVVDTNLYAQLNVGRAPVSGGPSSQYPGGCCADTLRTFGRDDGGAYSDLAIDGIITDLFTGIAMNDPNTGAPYAYVSHMFDMTTIDGEGRGGGVHSISCFVLVVLNCASL